MVENENEMKQGVQKQMHLPDAAQHHEEPQQYDTAADIDITSEKNVSQMIPSSEICADLMNPRGALTLREQTPGKSMRHPVLPRTPGKFPRHSNVPCQHFVIHRSTDPGSNIFYRRGAFWHLSFLPSPH